MEIVFIGINYALFSKTNQMGLINSFLIEKIFNISGNILVHISHTGRFIMSNVIHSIAVIINFIISLNILIRLMNLMRLCALFKWHYNRRNNEHSVLSTCSFQVILYIIWLLLNVITLILKAISINYAYRSHILIKRLTKKSKRKKKKT